MTNEYNALCVSSLTTIIYYKYQLEYQLTTFYYSTYSYLLNNNKNIIFLMTWKY